MAVRCGNKFVRQVILVKKNSYMLKMRLAPLMLVLASIGFLLNLIWELAQMSLYTHAPSFWSHVPMCIVAAVGDAVILFLLYAVIVAIHQHRKWVESLSVFDTIFLIIVGGMCAIGIEFLALRAGLWGYNGSMPLIPFFVVGLSPVLQMVVLPMATLCLTNYFLKIYATYSRAAASKYS